MDGNLGFMKKNIKLEILPVNLSARFLLRIINRHIEFNKFMGRGEVSFNRKTKLYLYFLLT